jgi:hypothetical protein
VSLRPAAMLGWLAVAWAGAAWASGGPSASAQALWETLRKHCVVHPQPDSKPDFPVGARYDAVFGRIVATLHFDAPDQPPVLDLVSRPTTAVLHEAVEAWARDLRRLCHAGDRVSLNLMFEYRFVGQRAGFSKFALKDLLALARDRRQREPFDTTGMRCPLAVHWQYLQPIRPNRVAVLGPLDPAHDAVVARLQALELALTRGAADVVWGDIARFEIPCHPNPSPPKE